jgi:LysM repeat protein
MDSNEGFDPKIERNYFDEDELKEKLNVKSVNGENQMKSFFKRADFPFFLLGGFVLVLLIFILFKLPSATKETVSDESVKRPGANELKQSLDDIRNEIVEIRYNLSSGSSSKDDLSLVLNELDKRFEQKLAAIEAKIDDLKSAVERGGKLETKTFTEKKGKDKKPLSEKKSELIKDSETVKSFYHTVKKGDTLYSISKKYSVDIGEIKKLNNMKNNSIHPGGRLLIKNN